MRPPCGSKTRPIWPRPSGSSSLIAIVAPVVTAGTALFSIIYLPFPAPELPEPKPSVESRITHILDANGQEIGVLRRFDTSIPVKQSDIPDITKAAVVAAEDKRFYSHNGVRHHRRHAGGRGPTSGGGRSCQGGSTITQQYIKKVYVGDERTLSRKIREAVLAGQLDRKVDKDEILYRYMSTVYYGGGAYGIGAAAESYFKKPVNDLNVSESAMLAGLLSAPSELDPRTNPKQAEANRLGVLDAMLDQKRISSVQHAQAKDQKIFLVGSTEDPPPANATLIYPVELQSTTQPYFVDYVVPLPGGQVRRRHRLPGRAEGGDDPRPQAPDPRRGLGEEGAVRHRPAAGDGDGVGGAGDRLRQGAGGRA